MTLPDPRTYAASDAAHPLHALAEDDARREELVRALRELASTGRDVEIGAVLACAASQRIYSALWKALCTAIEKPAREDDGVHARVFAIPWVIVCAAGSAATLPCVLPNVGELGSVLESQGVFGTSRNLGLSNALVSIASLEALRPSEVLEWARTPGTRDMPPAEIQVTRGAEEVHVRFLLGAAIAPPNAADVVETGSNIGAWGTPALRAMSTQLATAGVDSAHAAPAGGPLHSGFRRPPRGTEAAFNLFMGNGVRRFRVVVGDPSVTLSAHASGELRITLWSPLDETLVEGFRWPLHPADDLGEVERTITTMLWDCRLSEPHYAAGVLPDYSQTGAALFPTR